MRFFGAMLLVRAFLVLAVLTMSGCATPAPSPVPAPDPVPMPTPAPVKIVVTKTACIPIQVYTKAEDDERALELAMLPPRSMISVMLADYDHERDELKACAKAK